MELKQYVVNHFSVCFVCSNRTFMELKLRVVLCPAERSARSNRTFMELKPMERIAAALDVEF